MPGANKRGRIADTPSKRRTLIQIILITILYQTDLFGCSAKSRYLQESHSDAGRSSFPSILEGGIG